MKNIAILGSTGSIGRQTLEIVEDHPEDFCLLALSCGRNIKLFVEQILTFHPILVSVEREEDLVQLRERLVAAGLLEKDLPEMLFGMEGLLAVAELPSVEILVTAIVGMIGIRPTIAAIESGKDIALANKETLVCAGQIIIPLAKEKGVRILPVDSEHSAIFQSLQGNEGNTIDHILLTCSGGPFRGMEKEDLKKVSLADALKHPNWSMGRKITIDSATLVNKGLEMIEAHWLFGVAMDRIQVMVHPQSILHSAVAYEDGAVIGQMGTADMKLPIAYALYYPCRKHSKEPHLDLFAQGQLTFEKPKREIFRGLDLAERAMARGGNMPTIFNALNEYAVALFLQERIPFLGIYELIEEGMTAVNYEPEADLEQILQSQEACLDWIKTYLERERIQPCEF